MSSFLTHTVQMKHVSKNDSDFIKYDFLTHTVQMKQLWTCI